VLEGSAEVVSGQEGEVVDQEVDGEGGLPSLLPIYTMPSSTSGFAGRDFKTRVILHPVARRQVKSTKRTWGWEGSR